MRLLALTLLFCAACAEQSSSRTDTIVDALVASDLQALRTRPLLVEGKYTRMSLGLFEYFRGSLPVYLHDVQTRADLFPPSSYVTNPPIVPGLGDAHVENFGTMRASDGTFALEPNDFDACDMWPFLWDLRRLLVAIVIAARDSNLGDEEARAAAAAESDSYARETLQAYITAMHGFANGTTLARVVEATDQGAVLDDAFSRSRRDDAERRELTTLTRIDERGERHLIRGAVDGEASNTLANLPQFAVDSLASLLRDYRRTLVLPFPENYFNVLDAAREFGSGIASWPRVRVVVLIDGPTPDREDDLLLEIKETGDSGGLAWTPPGPIADSIVARIRVMSRGIWARPDADPLLSAINWFGMPVVIRTESDAFKTLRVSRLVNARGTPDALRDMSRALGALLARVHASALVQGSEGARAIDTAVQTDVVGFVNEESAFALRYADIVAEDFALFRAALNARGARLGVRTEPGDRAHSDASQIFGVPESPLPVSP